MVKTVQIKRTGEIKVLEFIDKSIGEPKAEEALVRHTAIGLNRYDLEQRIGIRKIKNLPLVLGVEAVGVIEKLGKKIINGLQIGDKVGYCTAPPGAYCEKRIIHQKYLIKIPEEMPDEIVAAILFKGMTAHYLVNQSYKIRPGAIILVHGASGGLGQIVCQWANNKKGIVIGSVSSNEKIKIALQNGCTYAINYHDKDFISKIMEITQNKGVGAVYDPIGYATSKLSFKSLGKFGIYISYGQISGHAPISFSLLSSRSLFATGTSIYHYKNDRFTLVLTAMEIFEMIKKKLLTVNINKKYKFDEIIEAHLDMENRKISGLNIIKIS
ncbi:zinc-binding dehydrogenase [Wolbachia endosymbiont of Dipetalonema caudispina]|uniref:quinone oxidoreductase family protein n=1 Tax=Wolbachia endosymbiont of Dipetalonema caudispina TaxID=1812112 RepID=UPI00158CB161|nr:quinone oxidoreductase [Wolbachia endosymbiont of Dipetalonema caudispina]QKX00862.1 zinc-binding dehydrogenase [Wolbachia endosymbiont of Dipetalonema caudispina]